MTRHFRTLLDLSAAELTALLDRADELKRLRGTAAHPRPLTGKTVAVLLEKASTRTRISFEVGIHELGGHALGLASRDTQLGRGEPLADTARMLSRYTHGVVFRTFEHDRVEALAAAASIPVINGLSDTFHPCQLLADLMTVREAHGRELDGLPVTWIGDGNNVACSWMLAAAQVGLDLRLACPPGFAPPDAVLTMARARGARVLLTSDPAAAVAGARVVTTDVWASMGQEDEAERRRTAFHGYVVDGALMRRAAPDAVFLHCLPAHRGEEVAAEVIDGPTSRVWDEAENRLHSQKALLELLVAP